jgi:type I restriction enzyme S subunit
MTDMETITKNRVTIPAGWRRFRLKDVAHINPQRPPDIERSDDSVTSFVPMEAVDSITGTISNPRMRTFGEVNKGYTFFGEGDVLFAKITPCMQNGKHAIARNLIDGIGFGTTEFHVLRPGPEIVAEWIHYFLRQPSLLLEATKYFTGAVGQQRLPENYLANLEIPLPPLSEQERIVSILNEQLAAVERARKAAKDSHDAASALPASILRCFFGSNQSASWKLRKLSDISELLPSRSIASDGDAEVSAITTACLSESGFAPFGIKRARMLSAHVNECLVKPGEVLVARSNTEELVGRVSMYEGYPPNIVASDLTIRILPDEKRIRPSFLAWYLSFLFQIGFWRFDEENNEDPIACC